MDKEDVYTYICNIILFSHEKEGNPTICSNMDRFPGHYAEISDRERPVVYDITYM